MLDDIFGNALFVVLVGLFSFGAEFLFFQAYAPNDRDKMDAFVACEKGKGIIGMLVGVAMLTYFVIYTGDKVEPLVIISGSIGMFSTAYLKGKAICR